MQQTEIAALCVVGVLIVLDYATGLMKAAMQHDISSEKMRLGLWHKSGLILVMVLAEVVERAQAYIDLGFTLPLIVPAAVYISITEISSILENLGEINPEIKASPLLQLFRSKQDPGAMS
ncbi:phage holin family protein [Bifidobacterium cebidarum]|uniref:Holin n=1 Tax=Bifidobacterium cebidarum TaxID=2650773 RepID=A0A6I1GD57_9BIFI|nr:phage holin family protein [Bifidobacterium cebidarum]KAB7789465.1 holin [Bifidobacterium cebidarum]